MGRESKRGDDERVEVIEYNCTGLLQKNFLNLQAPKIPDLHIFVNLEFNSRFTCLCKNGIHMIERDIFQEAKYMLSQFRALCITGPRQSGKTTLGKVLFKGKPYINFELPFIHAKAENNIALFMNQYKSGAILDEVQRIPVLFRQLQGMLDKSSKRGQFLLTGSNNFLLQEQISQSLAGRAGYLELLPLTFSELKKAKLSSSDISNHIIKGGYPEIWQENLNPYKWMSSYIQTYIQKDVRQLRNIPNLAAFTRFVTLCANYAGQIINRDELSKQTGVDTKTILAWLGVLESSYIIYQLQPWYNNLNKRIIKSPKLYFYDTGLLCTLLGIQTKTALHKHQQYGAIFENWVISEIKKNRMNNGINRGLYYFRDSAGNEVDLIMEKEGQPIAIEIKASAKPDRTALRGLFYWLKNNPGSNCILIHGGLTNRAENEQINLLTWMEVANIS